MRRSSCFYIYCLVVGGWNVGMLFVAFVVCSLYSRADRGIGGMCRDN